MGLDDRPAIDRVATAENVKRFSGTDSCNSHGPGRRTRRCQLQVVDRPRLPFKLSRTVRFSTVVEWLGPSLSAFPGGTGADAIAG